MRLRRRKRFRLGASTARRLARRMILQLPAIVAMLWRLMSDRRVSKLDRALFVGVLAYVLAPADFLPDFVILLGFVDDLYLVGLVLSRLLGRTGPDVLLEHWTGDPEELGYFVGSVEELGKLLPAPIRRAVRRLAKARAVA